MIILKSKFFCQNLSQQSSIILLHTWFVMLWNQNQVCYASSQSTKYSQHIHRDRCMLSRRWHSIIPREGSMTSQKQARLSRSSIDIQLYNNGKGRYVGAITFILKNVILVNRSTVDLRSCRRARSEAGKLFCKKNPNIILYILICLFLKTLNDIKTFMSLN